MAEPSQRPNTAFTPFDTPRAAARLFIAHLGWTPKRIQAVMGHLSVRLTIGTGTWSTTAKVIWTL